MTGTSLYIRSSYSSCQPRCQWTTSLNNISTISRGKRWRQGRKVLPWRSSEASASTLMSVWAHSSCTTWRNYNTRMWVSKFMFWYFWMWNVDVVRSARLEVPSTRLISTALHTCWGWWSRSEATSPCLTTPTTVPRWGKFCQCWENTKKFIQIIEENIDDFLTYLEMNRSMFFSSKNYIQATPEYLTKAGYKTWASNFQCVYVWNIWIMVIYDIPFY